jgi:hypothetical protein
MHTLIRSLVLALAALALTAGPASAQSRYRGHGGYYHGGHGWGHDGRVWGGLGIGLGIGLGAAYYYGSPWGWYPGYVVVPPTTVYETVPAPAQPAAVRAPDPIVYPRNGQSAEQTEADRQACNRWATTQPSAMADASVFQRATAACMEGRGYTLR